MGLDHERALKLFFSRDDRLGIGAPSEIGSLNKDRLGILGHILSRMEGQIDRVFRKILNRYFPTA